MSEIRIAGVLPTVLLALLPFSLVAQDQDLVLTTVNPCVIFDTRQLRATFATVDTNVSFFGDSSITIGSDGLGLISYYDHNNIQLKVAHLSNVFGVPFHRRR